MDLLQWGETLPLFLINFWFDLYLDILYAPFCSDKSPTFKIRVTYGTQRHTNHLCYSFCIYNKTSFWTYIGVHQEARRGRCHFPVKNPQFIQLLEAQENYMTSHATMWWPINMTGNFIYSEGTSWIPGKILLYLLMENYPCSSTLLVDGT